MQSGVLRILCVLRPRCRLRPVELAADLPRSPGFYDSGNKTRRHSIHWTLVEPVPQPANQQSWVCRWTPARTIAGIVQAIPLYNSHSTRSTHSKPVSNMFIFLHESRLGYPCPPFPQFPSSPVLPFPHSPVPPVRRRSKRRQTLTLLPSSLDSFAYARMVVPPMPPPWSAGEPQPMPTLAPAQHEEAPSYARHGIDHQESAQAKFNAPSAPTASHLGLGSNAAVGPTRVLSARPYTGPAHPTVPVLPATAFPAPSTAPTRWSDQMAQMAQMTSGRHPDTPAPIAMPFAHAQTHSGTGTVPGSADPLRPTAPVLPPPAPYAAPPPLHINTNLTGTGEHQGASQSHAAALGAWSPWTMLCPQIVVDSDPSLSSIDPPGSARSGASSLSPHDLYHHAYLLSLQSPATSSSHYSPYSDFSVVTPSSLISMFDYDNSQNMLGNLASHPESSASAPNVGFDAHLLSTLPASKSPHESQFRTHLEAGSASRTNELEDPPYPYPSTSTVTGPHFEMPQGLGQRDSTDNSSDSTLRLSLGQPPYSGPAPPAFPVAQGVPALSFPIPETVEDDDDDPVPEYTGGTAPNKKRRKGEAISSVPLRECFVGDALRRTLLQRILAKPWLRAHSVEPVFLATDDDVTAGVEKQVACAFGMKKGDSLFKAFEGQGGQCPFDGCPNVEPRAHRRISHVRTHFGLRPFSCDPRGCARCQARIERGLEYVPAC